MEILKVLVALRQQLFINDTMQASTLMSNYISVVSRMFYKSSRLHSTTQQIPADLFRCMNLLNTIQVCQHLSLMTIISWLYFVECETSYQTIKIKENKCNVLTTAHTSLTKKQVVKVHLVGMTIVVIISIIFIIIVGASLMMMMIIIKIIVPPPPHQIKMYTLVLAMQTKRHYLRSTHSSKMNKLTQLKTMKLI